MTRKAEMNPKIVQSEAECPNMQKQAAKARPVLKPKAGKTEMNPKIVSNLRHPSNAYPNMR